MTCECDICKLATKVAAIQTKLSPEDAGVIERLWNNWEGSSMDASHYKAILKGQWPGTKPVASAAVPWCSHEWEGPGDMPKYWYCKCGTKIYRSYEDYCWD
jgi:hypothetical protein